MASGEFVAILNSDDVWALNKLERQVERLRQNPQAALCYSKGAIIDDGGAVTLKDQHGSWPTAPLHEVLPELLLQNNMLASSVLWRREWLRFDSSLRYSGDWIAGIHAALRGPAAFIEEPLAYWRQHGENTYLRFGPVTMEELRVRMAILGVPSKRWLVRDVEMARVRDRLGWCALHLAPIAILWGNRRLGIRSALRAVRGMADKRLAARRLARCLMPREVALRRLFPGVEFRGRWNDVDLTPVDFGFPQVRP
jgi:hypothetical protein